MLCVILTILCVLCNTCAVEVTTDYNVTTSTSTSNDCDSPQDAENGNVSFNSTTYGQNITYTCNEGYNMTAGDQNQTCQEDGKWNGKTPTCTLIEPNYVTEIIIGVLVIFLFLTITGGAILFMKKQQKGCFAKCTESIIFSADEPDRVELDDIVENSNCFSPEVIQLADFTEYVTNLHKDNDMLFSEAFKLLKERSPAYSVSIAELQTCRPKNRYSNILAFDHSRVKLIPLDDEEGSDYINANYIPGFQSKRAYIATQGPMIATFDDFWRMVWEQNVEIIVMLTKLVERGRVMCTTYIYWPDANEPEFYGDLMVTTTSESNLSDYTIRILEVKLENEVKTVRQYSFLKWPDMGFPEPNVLLGFVKTVRNEFKTARSQHGPLLVHCSAGVGRTGTFIAVDHLLQHIRDHDKVDIYNLVLEMRKHRCNMVQTEGQFIYIHECLKEFITSNDDEDIESDDPVCENTVTTENV